MQCCVVHCRYLKCKLHCVVCSARTVQSCEVQCNAWCINAPVTKVQISNSTHTMQILFRCRFQLFLPFLQLVWKEKSNIHLLIHNFSYLIHGLFIIKTFHWIGPLGRFSHRVAMSVCPSVCLWRLETPSSGGGEDLWSKNIFLILGCDDKIVKQKMWP